MRTWNSQKFLILMLCLITIYGIISFYYISQPDSDNNEINMEQKIQTYNGEQVNITI